MYYFYKFKIDEYINYNCYYINFCVVPEILSENNKKCEEKVKRYICFVKFNHDNEWQSSKMNLVLKLSYKGEWPTHDCGRTEYLHNIESIFFL